MSSLSRRSLLGALGAVPAAQFLRAQQQTAPVPGYSATVKVVNLLATVRDKQGKVVTNLTREDFLLDDEGKPQTIRYFSRETDLPLTLGLLVDTSGSERNVLPDERNASYRFLDTVMRVDKDMAFLIHFDFEVELLQDLTNSKVQLQKAMDRLEVRQLQRRGPGNRGGYPGGNGDPGPRRGGSFGHGGTALYDAVFLGADEVLKHQQGRKALIVLSDGVDNGSRVTLDKAIETAQRSDTLVYSILFEDPNGQRGFGGHSPWGGGRGRGHEGVDGHKVLERLSRETGGRYFEVSKKMSIDQVYESLAEELHSQYSIGYTPDSSNSSTDYRRIHLTTKDKSMTVQTREGYYPS